ncbi:MULTISPECIES: hypothetical protein [Pseudofrankia]|uniref:hypothetical protein n=1 Tax=Pseudofrankia TaxID=2994363 RepID=UPI000234B2B3|nr:MULTISPECIES: hypothetical protein [Pseudofrankia]OHV36936.1 hypothetical protein BCD49_16815 [Pseudofrankia sp. EUN1h]
MGAAAGDLHPVLSLLAGQLLRELELVATFTVVDRLDDPEPLTGHLLDRGLAITEALDALDAGTGPHAEDDAPPPHATDHAAGAASPGDHASQGDNGPVTPGRLAGTLLGIRSWIITADDPAAAEAAHLFAVALPAAADGGIPAAIDHLLELVARGHVLDPRSAGDVAGILVIASAAEPTPAQLRAPLAADLADEDGQPATVPAAWLTPLDVATPAATRIVTRILEAVLTARRDTLAAPDLDTWLVGLHTLSRLVAVAQTAVATALARPSVSVRAILAQLEEQRADVAALMVAFAGGSLPACLAYEDDVAAALAARLGTSTAGRRFRAERQLVPDELLVRPTPPHWFTPSWRVAAALRTRNGGAPPFVRAGPPRDVADHPGGLPQERDVAEVMAALATITELADAGSWHDGAVAAQRLVYDFPWCDVGHWKAAQCLRGLGQRQGALDAMVPAISLQPTQPVLWESLATCLDDLGEAASAELAQAVAERLAALDDESDAAPRTAGHESNDPGAADLEDLFDDAG